MQNVSKCVTNRVPLICAFLMSMCLAACGGGGYSGGNSTSGSCGIYGCSSSSSSSMSSSSSSTSSSSSSTSSSSSSSSSVMSISMSLTPAQIFPIPNSNASGTAALSFDTTNGWVSGTVTTSGVTDASAVTINDAFAGNTGSMVVALTPGTSGWAVPDGTTLTTQQWSDFWAGKLYVLVTSPANPDGELRAQIIPTNAGVWLVFADVTPAMVVTSSTSGIPGLQIGTDNLVWGRAAVTVNSNSTASTAAVNVNLWGTASDVQLFTGGFDSNGNSMAGTWLSTLTADSANASHYMNESISLSASDVTNFTSNNWYVNVGTSAHPLPNGEARGQIMTPPTLADLQSNIFHICAACHTGPTSTSLPSGQDLTPGHTFTSVVNVPSIEQSTLMRIRPGDPENSYLIHKVEGWTTINGVQMPYGGPYLKQAQIATILAWVTAGAPNN